MNKPFSDHPQMILISLSLSEHMQHFFFPSFNLKQKRHRGSKIKISFFPSPKHLPQLRHCNHPLPAQQGLEQGGCRHLQLGREGGEGWGGVCRARCQSLSKYKYTCQNSWKLRPTTHHACALHALPAPKRGGGGGCQAFSLWLSIFTVALVTVISMFFLTVCIFSLPY